MQTACNEPFTIENIKNYVVGYDKVVPTIKGELKRYINLDNSASTPTLTPVLNTINEFMEWYSSIHRGTGFKSQLSTHFYEQSREIVRRFCNVRNNDHTIIFGKNATEAINKLAHRIPLKGNSVIFTSRMEHHSNDLPWRMRAPVVYIGLDEKGRVDINDLHYKLKTHRGRVQLVAITGASNVTGYINPISEIAEIVHTHKAELMVDASQLAPHRKIDMGDQDDPSHIDYLAFSAHKIYAPFGLGVLIANRKAFEEGDPDYVGGGTVDLVSTENVLWADVPEKEEAGTPNVVGAVALAKAIQVVTEIGMDEIARHEARLTEYALKKMIKIPGLIIYGSTDEKEVENRLGVIPFNLQDMPHGLVASMLNYESAIGVRNGCFCAQPYIRSLLHTTAAQSAQLENNILHHDRSNIPGAVRMSFGMYNEESEIDAFIEALEKIVRKETIGKYNIDKTTGEYKPQNFKLHFDEYFRL